MKNLALIPARGGSKRIPQKNIKNFLGKPIIAYSIETAFNTGIFDEVMVSTDTEEIGQVARSFGASVPFLRSEKNADDFATTVDVVKEVIEQYKSRGIDVRYVCCIYPTAPLLKSHSIIRALEVMKEFDFNTVFPIVAFSFPIGRSLILEGKKVKMIWPKNIHARSQDLAKAWHDAGQFYWINVSAFMMEPLLYSSNSGAIELSPMEVQDIDSMDDWKLAELKASLHGIQ